MKETAELLDKWAGKLAELVQNTAPEAWEITMRGVIAEAWAGFVVAFAVSAVSLLMLRWLWRRKDRKDPVDWIPVWVAIGTCAIVAIVRMTVSLHAVIMVSIAPEYMTRARTDERMGAS